ncbi:hypothetical protein [Gordonia sp. (in: high G+C Gram-positive bacteria)]|uniref:hypothetical protein n=1 Tax=Gordonia sp. (in: high G+C Gram-positive bacteria) TaxID=84139 RepID=UPI003C771249
MSAHEQSGPRSSKSSAHVREPADFRLTPRYRGRMSRPRVLQIGMDPAVIDFSPWPGQSADRLQARIDAAAADLSDAGFDVTVCLLHDDPDAAENNVRLLLAGKAFDVVEIGSGLRTSHDYTPVFERALNTVVALLPGTPLCFNDSPETTLEAVNRVHGRRWASNPRPPLA